MHVTQVREQEFQAFCKAYARSAGVCSILIGAGGIVGWLLHIPFLRSVYPGLVPTTLNSSLALILSGFALHTSVTHRTYQSAGRFQMLAVVCTLAVVIIAGVTLGEYLFHRDLRIDDLIFNQPAADSASPARMAPVSAVTFLVLNAALFLTIAGWGIPVAQMMGLLASFLGVLAITGYVFQIRTLYAIGTYTPMSVQMAVMSAVLGLGVLAARPERALMRVLASPNVGGIVARRLMPLGIGFPFLLVLLAYAAQVVQLGRTQFGGVIFLFLAILVFTAPILWTAGILYRTDKKRERAERHLATQYAVARLLSSPAPAHEIAQPVLEEICGNLDWDSGKIWEVDRDTRRLKCIAAFNCPLDEEYSVSTKALEFPIRSQDVTVGLIECCSQQPRQRDDEVVRVMETIATHIGQFVERKRAEREIRRLNQDLQERAEQLNAANKELEAFSYSVSHDLRAPLRHISGFIQLLTKRSASVLDDQGNRYLKVIADSCTKMGTLVDDLLAFSRMGRADMLQGRVDLNGIVQQVIRELTSSSNGRQIEWAIDPLPDFVGDAVMMRIVLMNYVSNALKYTQNKETARIEISSCPEADSQLIVYVRDNGAGFDMKYAGKLFGVFQRLHRDDEFEGTGIGLATARRIVGRHGGRTWAEAAPGAGATFYFSVPRRSLGAGQVNPLKPILLAEDSSNDIELTLAALQEYRIANQVVVVRDGLEVLDYLNSRGQFADRSPGNPALVLLDLKMPRMDGLETLAIIKADEQLKAIPVVMLTSSREETDLVRSYRLGVNGYVVKPVDFQAFIDAVKEIGAFWAVLNETPRDGSSGQNQGQL